MKYKSFIGTTIILFSAFIFFFLVINCAGNDTSAYYPADMEEDSYYYDETEGETYKDYGINPEISTEETNISTFSIDVDTGSYSVARRFITENYQLPTPEAVRAEEFVNYFDYKYELPEDNIFNVDMEVAKSMYRDGKYILRIGVQGKDVPYEERKRANLIFLIDVSGSMDAPNKLPLIKESLKILLDNLKQDDMVGIAIYYGDAQIYMNPTFVSEKKQIIKAINKLRASGSTNAEGGIKIAYEMVAENYMSGGINRVILCSDGDANVGRVSPDELIEIVKEYKDLGITLSTMGFGMGNYNDYFMEQLANKGDGNYAYIDTYEEAKRIFNDKLVSILEVIARDVKIQVEFNKENVKTFRLIGYENRLLEEEDFDKEEVDAGEVGALHSVTALYELQLNYNPQGNAPLVEFRMKWKDDFLSTVDSAGNPYEMSTTFYEKQVKENVSVVQPYYKLAVNVAEFAEILRESPYVKETTLDKVIENTETTLSDLKNYDKAFDELLRIMQRAFDLKTNN